MPLIAPWDLGEEAARDIADALNRLLADAFSLLLKTKSFRWHVSGRHFRDHHLLFCELEEQIHIAIEEIAERVRRVGAMTLHSVGQVARLQRLVDNDAVGSCAPDGLAELLNDNLQLAAYMRDTHGLCEGYGDVATASYLEKWIDEAEGRVRYLFAMNRPTEAPNAAVT